MTQSDTDQSVLTQSHSGPTTEPLPSPESLDELRRLISLIPAGDEAAAVAVAVRQMRLTKPQGSLGRLEEFAAWLARWQRREMPQLQRVEALIFAGNHGVAALGVSAYPPSVTAQMVANFEAGGAAINQICESTGTALRVMPLKLDEPTGDFTAKPAMSEDDFLDAVRTGFEAVSPQADLLCLGEMGIANTTAAAALAAGLYGGDIALWIGAGTGLDQEGLKRKQEVVEQGLVRHQSSLGDPLQAAMCLGGRELAAMFGAALAARLYGVPALLDGFISTAAVAPLAVMRPGGLDHAEVAHCSAEPGHRKLCGVLHKRPILDLDMRLGEGSGAVLAVSLMRAALACHQGMATFDEAGVDERD